jgi:NAD(P)-dependent dehydrogenase (short-subunit alcohol dehydrogenase family)
VAKVLVIGASRGIGLETVRAALRAGHSVRRFGAISRADVADFLVRQLNDRSLIGTTPLLIS